MDDPSRLTMEQLLYYLRQRLLDARHRRDETGLRELEVTLDCLVQAAYEKGDRAVAEILIGLEDSTRDSLTGVDAKSTIPTIDAIKSAVA